MSLADELPQRTGANTQLSVIRPGPCSPATLKYLVLDPTLKRLVGLRSRTHAATLAFTGTVTETLPGAPECLDSTGLELAIELRTRPGWDLPNSRRGPPEPSRTRLRCTQTAVAGWTGAVCASARETLVARRQLAVPEGEVPQQILTTAALFTAQPEKCRRQVTTSRARSGLAARFPDYSFV